jgi:hypothetical protein
LVGSLCCSRHSKYWHQLAAIRSEKRVRPPIQNHSSLSPEEELLTQDIIELARQYGRYGYRPVAALLIAALHRNEANGRFGSTTAGFDGPGERPLCL